MASYSTRPVSRFKRRMASCLHRPRRAAARQMKRQHPPVSLPATHFIPCFSFASFARPQHRCSSIAVSPSLDCHRSSSSVILPSHRAHSCLLAAFGKPSRRADLAGTPPPSPVVVARTPPSAIRRDSLCSSFFIVGRVLAEP